MRAISELQFGALREKAAREKAGSTVAESLVALYWVGTHQIRLRWKAARSSTNHRSAEPLCARIKGANRRFLKEKVISDHGLFSSYEGQQRSGEWARFVGIFQGCTGLWKAGCWLARRLHELKASTTMDLGISVLLDLYDVWP